MSEDTDENEKYVKVEPQPVLQLGGTWLYGGNVYSSEYTMSDYLFNVIYNEGLGNSPDFECEPTLIGGVWYWEAWS